MPPRRSRGRVQSIEIMILMAGIAPHDARSQAIDSASDPHGVRVAVLTLARIIANRMTVHTPGVTKNGNDCFKCRGGRYVVTLSCW